MASTLLEKYSWNLTVSKNGNPAGGATVCIRDSSAADVSTNYADNNGNYSAIVVANKYDIGSSVEKTEYNPYSYFIGTYDSLPSIGLLSFSAKRIDAVKLYDDLHVSSSDRSAVDAYTGIQVDTGQKIIKITDDHTISELYDYCKSQHVHLPDMDNPSGIITTTDGKVFSSNYDIQIDGCFLHDDIGHSLINISNNTLTISNGGDTDIPIRSSAGTRTFIEIKVVDLDGNPISGARVFLEDEDGKVVMNDLTDSNGIVKAVYNYNGYKNVDGRVRKGSSYPYFKTAKLSGKIVESGFQSIVYMVKDD